MVLIYQLMLGDVVKAESNLGGIHFQIKILKFRHLYYSAQMTAVTYGSIQLTTSSYLMPSLVH